MARRILITGAEGFIGTRLARAFAARGDQLTTDFVDITDAAAIRAHVERAAPEVVIHLAAISHPKHCDADRDLAERVNVGGTENLLAALRGGAPEAHLVFASTAHVYRAIDAGDGDMEIDETRELQPQSFYAETKRRGEVAIAAAGLRSTVLRLFNHTHKTQPRGFFVPDLYTAILEGVRRVPVGNLHVRRDFGSLQDLEAAFAAVVDRAPRTHSVFNICSGVAKRLSAIADELARRLGAEVEWVTDPSRVRPGEPEVICGSHENLTRITGWVPTCVNEAALVDAFLRE